MLVNALYTTYLDKPGLCYMLSTKLHIAVKNITDNKNRLYNSLMMHKLGLSGTKGSDDILVTRVGHKGLRLE